VLERCLFCYKRQQMAGVNWLYVMMFLELLATEMGCTFENPK
jgi:hypothetical protein